MLVEKPRLLTRDKLKQKSLHKLLMSGAEQEVHTLRLIFELLSDGNFNGSNELFS